MGGYVKRCRGINVYCKIENARGSRNQQCFVEGDYLKLLEVEQSRDGRAARLCGRRLDADPLFA
jgi:hypothetical protein